MGLDALGEEFVETKTLSIVKFPAPRPRDGPHWFPFSLPTLSHTCYFSIPVPSLHPLILRLSPPLPPRMTILFQTEIHDPYVGPSLLFSFFGSLDCYGYRDVYTDVYFSVSAYHACPVGLGYLIQADIF